MPVRYTNHKTVAVAGSWLAQRNERERGKAKRDVCVMALDDVSGIIPVLIGSANFRSLDTKISLSSSTKQ